MMLIKGIKIDGCPLLELHDSLFVALVNRKKTNKEEKHLAKYSGIKIHNMKKMSIPPTQS